MTTRRGFLGAILAASAAPMIIRAGVLMPVTANRDNRLVLWGDGEHDDSKALQSLLNGNQVRNMGAGMAEWRNGVLVLSAGSFFIKETLIIPPDKRNRNIIDCSFRVPRPITARHFIPS